MKITVVATILVVLFYIVITSVSNDTTCPGESRIKQSYHIEPKPFKVVKDDYVFFACLVGDRVAMVALDGTSFVLPEEVESLYQLGMAERDFVSYYIDCYYQVINIHYYYQRKEEVLYATWYEPSYEYIGC